MDVVENIRLADELDNSKITMLYSHLSQFCDEYRDEEFVPKSTIYCLFVLHDNSTHPGNIRLESIKSRCL